jgi:hypothetical protein
MKIFLAVSEPEFLLRGKKGVKFAVINVGRNQWLHVMYRELKAKNDGFIITAYINDYYNKKLVIKNADT